MPRRKRVIKRDIKPDSVYGNIVIAKFINNIMRQGKKSTSENIVYNAFAIIEQKLKKPPVEVYIQAMKNVTPLIEVKPRRVGGATYQVPIEVKGDRGQALAMRWLINNSKKRPGRSMKEKLSAELIDAYNNIGISVKKREDTHKMAEANKAFAHYRY